MQGMRGSYPGDEEAEDFDRQMRDRTAPEIPGRLTTFSLIALELAAITRRAFVKTEPQ
jgi:hypothetical protein